MGGDELKKEKSLLFLWMEVIGDNMVPFFWIISPKLHAEVTNMRKREERETSIPPKNLAKVVRDEGNVGATIGRYCSIVREQKPGGSRPSVDEITTGSPVSLCSITFSAPKDCWKIDVHTVTQSSPSAGISFIYNSSHGNEISRISGAESDNGHSKSSCNEPGTSKVLKDVHISAQLMEDFLELSRDNTNKDLETCGVLGAFLKEGIFYVTTLIIPKQESTSNSCQALNEEEIFAIQNEQSLFPVGWIHTHPSQSCFMSSIDVHTQYSYQMMVPEAVAIVMAPTDKSRKHGIFRLSDPVGMNILKECQERGFHTHEETVDGSSIYEQCSNVYVNPYVRLEICDLR
ncbi:unnamed protein product [Ilex paraguariensis]|uniref:MPN domain-containing protein n=1 Tax=Ilex paraguariensis TaxID=185542 RepID=A0ABC8UG84_9AQUA